jgi:predicted membrane-bound mannosyltransferase
VTWPERLPSSGKKIQELHSAQKYAVIQKGVPLRKNAAEVKVPRGTIAVAEQKIEIRPGGEHPPQTIAVGGAAYVVDEAAFEKALHRPWYFRRLDRRRCCGRIAGGGHAEK